ncbi:HNH endonuclease signature motif containing protein [Kitasatospora cinereorecta]|uniref:HNH endonuclease signature motif containing protein n=1 Tax=Kitasatospora cinereorecta TaxID=285560 RepID=A0ABW0VBW2_9ACTN
MSRTELIERVGKLVPTERAGSRAEQRVLLLLWALGQAVQGQSRLQPWHVVAPQLTKLLDEFTNAENPEQEAAATFLALQKDGLWEVSDADGRPTVKSLNAVNPLAGMAESDHLLVLAERGLAAELAALLILRFFNPLPDALLSATGLAELMAGRVTDWLEPSVGDRFEKREAIFNRYGGQKVAGIGALRDGILNCFSKDNGPYRDGRIEGTDWIAYVGDGQVGDQTLTFGNKQLAGHQDALRPLRFWHKPVDGQFTFESWVVVAQWRQQWGRDRNGDRRKEFVWVLAPVPSPLRDEWPTELVAILEAERGVLHDDAEDVVPPDVMGSELTPAQKYRSLCRAARTTTERRRGQRTSLSLVERQLRSTAARAAVILRSQGTCENPDCLGHSSELTEKGEPILEVDHVNGLARSGEDEPEFMIALCPNCHALKTRGANRHELTRKLRARAKQVHAAFVAGVS